MSDFTFDTSGSVDPYPYEDFVRATRWSDLTPFEQGYVEAMFASLNEARIRTPAPVGYTNAYRPKLLGFSDLAPETLAAIRKDCASFRSGRHWPEPMAGHEQFAGEHFWSARQLGNLSCHGYPPLTLYIADDGKVYQRVAS